MDGVSHNSSIRAFNNNQEVVKATTPNSKTQFVSSQTFAHISRATEPKTTGLENRVRSAADYQASKPMGFFQRFLDKLANVLKGRGFITTEKYLKMQTEQQNDPRVKETHYKENLGKLNMGRDEYELRKKIQDASRDPNPIDAQNLRARIKEATKNLDVSWWNNPTESGRPLSKEFEILADGVLNSRDKEAIKAFEDGVLEREDAVEFYDALGEKVGIPFGYTNLKEQIQEKRKLRDSA